LPLLLEELLVFRGVQVAGQRIFPGRLALSGIEM